MNFHYPFARLPRNRRVVDDVHRAAGRLFAKLGSLDVKSLEITDSNKRYFGGHVTNARSTVRRFGYLLSWAMADTTVPYEEAVFVDYGGGDGSFSLLAKELGIGTVIYVDLYEPSCRDARQIGRALDLEAEHYVHGDLDVLLEYIRARSISCHALGSYDVIEHVYDIESFLGKLSGLSKGPLSVVLASGANPRNPRIRRALMDFQRKAEHGGRQAQKNYKPDFCTTAYVLVRKEIIQQKHPSLSNAEVDRLVKATRGKNVEDIGTVVDHYAETGEVLPELAHPTNTCNPHNGNWCERLMEPTYLRDVLTGSGFDVRVLGGYYGSSEQNSLLVRAAGGVLNPLITMLGPVGLTLSPFYTLHARRNGVKAST